MRIYRISSLSTPHVVYVKDRPRNSGLTSLRFAGPDRVVCCDYNEKTMYLLELGAAGVELLATIPTSVRDGTPVQTDLLDLNDEGLLVTSNFYQGTQTFYALHNDTLSFVEEMKLTDFTGCHGVRFVPGYDELLWISYCGKENRFIVVADYRKKKILHMLEMSEQIQDAAFIGDYVLVAARTDHIRLEPPFAKKMYATMYLLHMPDNLYSTPPRLIDTWRGSGHLDAIKEHAGLAYSANQYNDTIDVFGIGAEERIEQLASIPGFEMPHGLDIRNDGLLGVTNYADNSLRFVDLASEPSHSAATMPRLTRRPGYFCAAGEVEIPANHPQGCAD